MGYLTPQNLNIALKRLEILDREWGHANGWKQDCQKRGLQDVVCSMRSLHFKTIKSGTKIATDIIPVGTPQVFSGRIFKRSRGVTKQPGRHVKHISGQLNAERKPHQKALDNFAHGENSIPKLGGVAQGLARVKSS